MCFYLTFYNIKFVKWKLYSGCQFLYACPQFTIRKWCIFIKKWSYAVGVNGEKNEGCNHCKQPQVDKEIISSNLDNINRSCDNWKQYDLGNNKQFYFVLYEEANSLGGKKKRSPYINKIKQYLTFTLIFITCLSIC